MKKRSTFFQKIPVEVVKEICKRKASRKTTHRDERAVKGNTGRSSAFRELKTSAAQN